MKRTDGDLLSTSESSNSIKQRIYLAACSAIDERGIDKANVTEVCRRAGISRTTFYRHFHSVSDVLHWNWERTHVSSVEAYPLTADWRNDVAAQICNALERLVSDAAATRKRVRDEGGSLDYDSQYMYGCREREAFYRQCIEERTGKPCSEELLFAIRFFVNGTSMTINRWINDGMQGEMIRLADDIIRCIPRELEEALDSCWAS